MISIVIPLYNKAHTIENTLRTVLDQTFVNYEVILVNDGSTDDGVMVVQKFLIDSRFRLFNQHNQGVSVARNRGVEESKYEYIAFLDGDDEWLPGYLAKMAEAISIFPYNGMYCCAGFGKDASGTSLRIAHKYRNQILNINFFENPGVFNHTSATIVSKSVFNMTQGFPVGMKCNQDVALFFSIALISSVVYIGFPLSIYMGGVAGQTTSTSNEKLFSLLIHVIDRINMCYEIWKKTNYENKLYIIYDKYECRARILGFLKYKDYKSLNYFIDSLNTELKKEYYFFEFNFYKSKKLRLMSMIIIYLTKIRWRMYGFPIVGK